MDVFKEGKYIRFMERAPIWLGLSLVLLVIGIAFMFINKATTGSFFRLSIHFTGGQKIILRLAEEVELDGQNAAQVVKSYSEGEPIVQVDQTDPHVITIRMRVPQDTSGDQAASRVLADTMIKLKTDLGNEYGGYRTGEDPDPNPVTLEEANVGPTVRSELVRNAVIALLVGSLLIMIYIWTRFGRWQMSVAAVIALVHDVLITLGFTAIFRLEVADSFIAVILTIIGYSINDTIIIFDRVRENLRKYGDGVPLAQVANLSITQTYVRSINTVLTVIVMILALIFFGGDSIRDFMLAMLVGNIAGGYSSIFIASPMMVYFSGGKMKLEPEIAGPSLSFTPATPDFSVPEAEQQEPALEDASGGSATGAGKRKPAGRMQRRR